MNGTPSVVPGVLHTFLHLILPERCITAIFHMERLDLDIYNLAFLPDSEENVRLQYLEGRLGIGPEAKEGQWSYVCLRGCSLAP